MNKELIKELEAKIEKTNEDLESLNIKSTEYRLNHILETCDLIGVSLIDIIKGE